MAENAATLYIDKEVDSKLPNLFIKLTKCPVTVTTFDPNDEQHSKRNPLNILPCFVEKDICIWGTLPVFTYLAEKYPPHSQTSPTSEKLYGKTLKERTEINSMLYWCGGTLYRAVLTNYVYPQTKESYSLPGEENVKLLQLGHVGISQQLDVMEEHYLKDVEFMCGSMVNVVDYFVVFLLIELQVVGFDFTKWSKVKLWFDRMSSKVKELMS